MATLHSPFLLLSVPAPVGPGAAPSHHHQHQQLLQLQEQKHRRMTALLPPLPPPVLLHLLPVGSGAASVRAAAVAAADWGKRTTMTLLPRISHPARAAAAASSARHLARLSLTCWEAWRLLAASHEDVRLAGRGHLYICHVAICVVVCGVGVA